MTRALFAFLATFFFATLAFAGAPEMQVRQSDNTIEVGQAFTINFSAMTQDGVMPNAPQLPVTNAFKVLNTSAGPSFHMTFGGGPMKQGINVTWTVQAMQQGSFSIGPPSVDVNGTRYSSQKVSIKVVAQGSLPQKPQQQTNPFGGGGMMDPFDVFKDFLEKNGRPRFGLDDDDEPQIETDPKFDLPAGRDSGTFLHATVDKKSATLGEQVTLAIMIYSDITQNESDLNDVHEATTTDFLRHSLMSDDGRMEILGFGKAGTHYYRVKLIRKLALFPIKTGELDIGPMKLSLSPRGGTRASESFKVTISDPPLPGRPPGYELGDVGNFQIDAKVEPREVERGGSVAVTLGLSGSGNLPSTLPIPARKGVEWLTPEVRESLKASADKWGGSRTFAYVVRLTQQGDVDLGEIAIPFWNPDKKAYDTAKVSLGSIHVKPGPTTLTPDAPQILADLPHGRDALGTTRKATAHPTDGPLFWFGLGAPSLAFVGMAGARGLVRRVREKNAEKKASPLTDLKQRLKALDDACRRGESGAIDGATIRLLESAAIAHVSVNLRGATREESERLLLAANVPGSVVDDVLETLDECAAARFAPEGTEVSNAKERAERARALAGQLGKR